MLEKRQPGSGEFYMPVDILVGPLIYFAVYRPRKKVGDDKHEQQKGNKGYACYFEGLFYYFFGSYFHLIVFNMNMLL